MNQCVSTERVKFAAISFSDGADLLAAVAGKRLRVLSLLLVAAGSETIEIQSGGNTDLMGVVSLIAGRPIALKFNPSGIFQTAVGEALTVAVSIGGVLVSGHLTYQEI